MEKNHTHRGHVLRTVRPWTTEHSLETLKDDLKNKDWYAVGDGRHSIGDGYTLIEIVQDKNDLEYFDITIK